MTRFILTICALTILSCQNKPKLSQELALAMTDTKKETVLTCKKGALEYSLFDQPDINRDLYAVTFRSIPHSSKVHDLIIDMHLEGDGHFVSPNATGNFTGKFTVVIDKTDAFDLAGKLIENPLTKEEIDLHPFINGPVNWVRENTTYTQQIQLNTVNPFEVKGYIQFTIEPACTLEKVPFIIKQTDGVLKFEFFGC